MIYDVIYSLLVLIERIGVLQQRVYYILKYAWPFLLPPSSSKGLKSHSHLPKNCFIYFDKSNLTMMKNSFYWPWD